MTLEERIEELERIAKISRIFILDARGSWETQEGNYLIELIDDYNYRLSLT